MIGSLETGAIEAILAAMGDGVCVVDGDGRVLLANPAALALFKADQRLVGSDLHELLSGGWPPEKERRRYLIELRHCIPAGVAYRCDNARFHLTDHTTLPVSFSYAPLAPSGGVLVFHDISARRAAEEGLRESESRFRAVFNHASVGMLLADVEGRVVDCNQAMANMLSYTPPEMIGRLVFEFISPGDSDGSVFRSVVEERQASAQVERRLVSREGKLVHAQVAMAMLRLRGARLAVLVVENITQRKFLEVELRHSQKLESVGRLAAGIAHEINTPIQFVGDNTRFIGDALQSMTRLYERYQAILADAPAELQERARAADAEADAVYFISEMPKAVEQTLDGVHRVATIVRAMKTFAHEDRGQPVEADLNAALESTLTVARNELKYVAEVTLELGPIPKVQCYLTDLNQVFLNLLINAAHAIEAKQKDGDARGVIGVATRLDGDWVVISVSDSGTGIPEEIRDRIFDPFFTTKEVGKGTGQGLALARAVVEKHSGSIDFTSQEGVGTTFNVRIPLIRERSAA